MTTLHTYIPYTGWPGSLFVLDNRTLSQQREDALAVVRMLQEKDNEKWQNYWQSQPVLKMWHGYLQYAKIYYNYSLKEWARRGFAAGEHKPFKIDYREVKSSDLPPWFNDGRLHAVHRSQLLRANPQYYARFYWDDPVDLPDYWPASYGCRKTEIVDFDEWFPQ